MHVLWSREFLKRDISRVKLLLQTLQVGLVVWGAWIGCEFDMQQSFSSPILVQTCLHVAFSFGKYLPVRTVFWVSKSYWLDLLFSEIQNDMWGENSADGQSQCSGGILLELHTPYDFVRTPFSADLVFVNEPEFIGHMILLWHSYRTGHDTKPAQCCVLTLPWRVLQVASVCITSGFVAAKPTGSFATFADWASTLSQHSQLDLYISTARKQFAPGSFNYPFPSVLDAVQSLFLQGDPDPPAWKLKVSILGYYLLDSGVLSHLKVLTKPPFAWEESDVNLLEGRYYLDLYECSAGRDAQTFKNACMKLKVAGPAGMPFEVIEKLRCFGHPKQALAIWGPYRMTEGKGLEAKQAETLLQCRLDCGLLPDAFLGIRRHCQGLPCEERLQHLQTLIPKIAEWAKQEQHMRQLVLHLSTRHEVTQKFRIFCC